MSKVLVAGINGFVGYHLAHELQNNGVEVVGIGQDPELSQSLSGVVYDYICCDLADEQAVSELNLGDFEAIINLAGLAQVGASYKQKDLYRKINVGVHANLVARLAEQESYCTRVLAISTGAVYDSNQAMPLKENSVLTESGSPYALSKIAMEQSMLSYVDRGMDIVIVRPFNHIGPGQGPGFILPDLTEQSLDFRQNGTPLHVGNLKTKRDYTDVRDVVRAYIRLALADKLTSKIYNVCSGSSHSGEELLELVLRRLDLDSSPKVVVDTDKIRPNDAADIFGSHELLTSDTGWKPEIPFEQTIADFVSTKIAS